MLDCAIMALLEIDKRLVNVEINFLIGASKFKILFVTNISLALIRRQRPNIYDIRCYMQHDASKMFFFMLGPKIGTVKRCAKTST